MEPGKPGEPRARRVTSTDVAHASGVSRATVSYVLNNDPRQTISLATRNRVLLAAQELGYHPFAPARILRAGHSQIVLAVLPFEQIDPALARTLKLLEARLAEYGLTLIWHVGLNLHTGILHPSSNVTPAVVLSYADETDPTIMEFLRQFQVPVLSLLCNVQVQLSVGRLQARHLVQRGIRHLLYAAPARKDLDFLLRPRLQGVCEICVDAGLKPPDVFTVPASRAEALRLLYTLLPSDHVPQGICCYNDEVAFAVLAALSDAGLAVPEAVAVIGCDDIPLAQFSIPPLTTLRFAHEQSLSVLIETIVAASHGEPVTEAPINSVLLIDRASV